MRGRTTNHGKRWGAIAPLTAILALPLLGMLAFSIDIGYTVSVQSDLNNVADAGALAGAEKLRTLWTQYQTADSFTQTQLIAQATGSATGGPMKTAEQFAGYNGAGGVKITVPDGDVTFGVTDASGNFSTTYTGMPNTISVKGRRDGVANGSLGLFFGPVLGKGKQDLALTARATAYVGNITSFQNIGANGAMLPVALDVNSWTNFYNNGQSPDGNTYNGSNGRPQLQIYPDPGNAPGQFGLLSIGPPSTDTPTFSSWIDNGPSPLDIQYLLDHSLLPVSPSGPKAWSGGPGMKSTLQTDFASQIGQPRLIPLFQPVSTNPYQAASGNGSNATYNVIGFAAVTISQADDRGSNMNISVQPMTVNDPTAIVSWAPGATTQTYIQGVSTVAAKLSY